MFFLCAALLMKFWLNKIFVVELFGGIGLGDDSDNVLKFCLKF